MIKSNSSNRDFALKHIYNSSRNQAFHYILSNNGNESEAKDVFQESIIAFYENVIQGKFQENSSISTYLFSIVRFKHLNQIKKNQTQKTHEKKSMEQEEFDADSLAQLIQEEKRNSILEVFSMLGLKCRNLLINVIYHGKSPKEIIEEGNFGSEQVVRNQKSKCLSKLRELIKDKPEIVKIIRSDD